MQKRDILGPTPKYPGRARVMSRESARDYQFNRTVKTAGVGRNACSNPVELQAIGLPSIREGKGALPLTVEARCRKCPECLSHRRQLWTARAVDEIAAARRTWFGTFTVSPDNRFRLRVRAERKKLRAGREALSSLDASEQFAIMAAELLNEAQLWLKRVRSQSGEKLRYLLVAEAHKSGDPHLHILVHEPAGPITKRMLEDQWRLGFSHWRLVGTSPGAATYVCKYLAKDATVKVRASQRYGLKTYVQAVTERVDEMRAAIIGMQAERSDNAPQTMSGECGFSQRSGDPAPEVEGSGDVMASTLPSKCVRRAVL